MKKRILVTGAAGFIGARFVEALGGEPISVDHPEHFRTRAEHESIRYGEIVDRENLFDRLEQAKPSLSAIVHLGACTDTTELDEAYLTRVNLEYSKRLWSYASREKIPLVYASSAATYGDGALGYDDDEALIPKLKPLNPYGESKRLFDLWALERERAGEHPPTWSGFKFFNVYGFGERHKGKMASVVLKATDEILATGQVKLFRSHREGIRDGEQLRDFICVDDLIQVLRFALEKPIARGIYNLGTGRARSFVDLARAVFLELGRPEKIEFFDMPPVIRDRYQYFTEARMDRLRAQGYAAPFLSLEEGAGRTVRALVSKK